MNVPDPDKPDPNKHDADANQTIFSLFKGGVDPNKVRNIVKSEALQTEPQAPPPPVAEDENTKEFHDPNIRLTRIKKATSTCTYDRRGEMVNTIVHQFIEPIEVGFKRKNGEWRTGFAICVTNENPQRVQVVFPRNDTREGWGLRENWLQKWIDPNELIPKLVFVKEDDTK